MHGEKSEVNVDGISLPDRLLNRLQPSLTSWMEWLCPQVSDAMVAEIAAADYGFRAEEYLTDLLRIRDDRSLPTHHSELPLEVLELIRWSQPDDSTWSPGGQGQRGHTMRLFCCATLIAVANQSNVRQCLDEEPTLRQLISSALVLGEEAVAAILPLLCQRVPTLAPVIDDRPFFAMSILLLAAAHHRDEDDDSMLRDLCQWVISIEAEERSARQYAPAWLLGLKFSADGDDVWRELA